jgi:ribA/ribD-fused uncharacterized protein
MYPDSNLKLNYETDEAVHFFSGAYDALNNWSAHRVVIWGENFQTLEHGYHFRKFRETSPDVAAEILAAPSPWAAKQIERQHGRKRPADWEEIKVGVMRELLRAKIKQNQDVSERLLSTGTKKIYESSPWDKFWGCGEDGKGHNQMGKLLMEARDQIRAQSQA